MSEIINISNQKELLEQVFIIALKEKNKNIYISRNCMCKLLLKCSRKEETDEEATVKLIFKNSSLVDEIIISDVYNRVWEYSVFRLDYIKKTESENLMFEKKHNSSFDSDAVLLCEKEEDVGCYGNIRKEMDDYI